MDEKGWIYGVWYCGTSWTKVRLHGQYPGNFLKRALALCPGDLEILHCPSGTVTGPGVTVDAIKDDVRCPQVVADAAALPFKAGRFDLVLSDPPYTAGDSAQYGCKPFPLGKFVKEAHRVLRPGGHLAMLHTYYPAYRRQDWNLIGLIAVVTGFQRATRMFSILERRVRVGEKRAVELRKHREG
jgi:SAM-dependent methyltransferase